MALLKTNIEKLKKNNDIEGLLKAARSRKSDVRLGAFNALVSILNDREIIEKLAFITDDNDLEIRTRAIVKFVELGNTGAIGKLKPVIMNGTTKEKMQALRILGASGSFRDTGIANLVVVALNDRNPKVQLEAIRSMGSAGDRTMVNHLVDMLNDKRYTIRLEALRSLGRIGIEEAVEPVIGCLTDNRLEVRRAARESLAVMGSEKAKKALSDADFTILVKKMNESAAGREETLQLIGVKKIHSALPLVRRACGDDYKNVRLEAVRALRLMRDSESVPVIAKLIDDRYWDVRLEAVEALEKFPVQVSLEAVEKAMEDGNKNVRDRARDAFYSLKLKLEKKGE